MSSRRSGYYGYDPDAEAKTVRPAEAAAMRERAEADDATWITGGDEPVHRRATAANSVVEEQVTR